MLDIFDMHCHLGFYENPAQAAALLAEMGVGALSATVTPGEFERMGTELEGNVRVGVGLHPWWVADGSCGEAEIARACELAARQRYVAEIGLDFARGREASAKVQLSAFERMLSACGNGEHVLSIHAVRATAEALDALDAHGTLTAGNAVILHWFSGSSSELTRAVRMGCLFSVGPRMLATRRGREYARQIPAPQLLLETDLPSSAEEGELLSPTEHAQQLTNALDTLRELRGDDIADTIYATSTRLLELE